MTVAKKVKVPVVSQAELPPYRLVGTHELVEFKNNPRLHSPDQIEIIAASIREFGWTNPVLIDAHSGIIAGHGRVLAARKLGLAEVPCIELAHLTDAQRRAYVIADNQTALRAGWDDELLRLELGELKALDFDLGVLGFETGALEDLLAPAGRGAGQGDPDAMPEPLAGPVTRLGDLWNLGRHRLLCGDAMANSDVEQLLGGAKPDLANCDPPYGIHVVKGGAIKNERRPAGRVHGHGKAALSSNPGAIIETGVYAEVIGDDSTDTAIAAYKVLADIGVPTLVLWGGNYYANALPPSRCWFVWDKEVSGSFADIEMAWTNCDQVARLFRHQWNGLMKASERGERRMHPTQKPVALAEWVIETAAPKAAAMLDLFLGSGSSLIAAERKNIAHFGMELAPVYCDLSIIRWQKFTGLEATLLHGDLAGKTFAQVQNERHQQSAPQDGREPSPEVAEYA